MTIEETALQVAIPSITFSIGFLASHYLERGKSRAQEIEKILNVILNNSKDFQRGHPTKKEYEALRDNRHYASRKIAPSLNHYLDKETNYVRDFGWDIFAA